MEPNTPPVDPNNPNPPVAPPENIVAPVTSEPTAAVSPTTQPAVATASRSKKPFIIALIIILMLLIVGSVIALTHKSKDNTKTSAMPTTTVKNGKTYVSNAGSGDLAIKGVAIDQSLTNGYTQTSATTAQLASEKQSISDAGLANDLLFGGATSYASNSQTGGNVVSIFWGNTTSSYSNADFASKYYSYQSQSATKQGLTITAASAASVTITTSAGKKYSVPCESVTSQTSDKSTTYYQITCGGQLKGTNGFISYSTLSGSQTDAQSSLTKFVTGSKVEL